jgi:hypothetical protein
VTYASAVRLGSKLLATAVLVVATIASGAGTSDRTVPLKCTRGPDGQSYRNIVTMPASQPVGSTFTIRIDAVNIPISHFGLRYIHNMTADYTVPPGTTYVEGSARIVPGTGSSNVRANARVTHDASGIHMLLPDHVDNGTNYTAPSIEFQVKVVGSAGSVAPLGFVGTGVDASAALIGNVHTTCTPNPRPYTLASTRIDAPAP